MMRANSSRARNLVHETQGFAAVEFGLALPVLGLMLLGFVELDRYAWAARQLETTANSIAQILSQSNKVQPADMQFATDSVMVLFPRVLQDSARLGHKWSDDISVSMSAVGFKPTTPGCAANCAYEGKVGWSSGAARRPCNTPLTPVANGAAPTPTTLPMDAFGPNGIIVVDVSYSYRPLFADRIFGGFTIRRSSYMQPRYVSTLPYAVAGGDSFVTTCA